MPASRLLLATEARVLAEDHAKIVISLTVDKDWIGRNMPFLAAVASFGYEARPAQHRSKRHWPASVAAIVLAFTIGWFLDPPQLGEPAFAFQPASQATTTIVKATPIGKAIPAKRQDRLPSS